MVVSTPRADGSHNKEDDMFELFDMAMLVILVLVVPVALHLGNLRMRRQLAAGEPGARLKDYWVTIAWQWALVAVLVALWFASGRTASALGFPPPAGWRFWTGLLAVVAMAAVQLWQMQHVRRTPETWEPLRQQFGEVADFVPHTERELTVFSLLSVTAGVCEEILYRGYLVWLLAALSGTWAAVFGSTVVFTLAHLYQGPKGMVRVFAVGLVMAALYLFTGSLLAPILLHAVIDLTSGRLGFTVVTAPPQPAADAA